MYNFEDQSSTDPLLLWLVHFIALLQKRHFLPDAALVLLLRFFAIFFNILSGISPQLTSFSQQFPPGLYKFHKLLGARQEEAFVRYVVCPICSMVYNYDDCLERNGTQTVALNCTLDVNPHAMVFCCDAWSLAVTRKFSILIVFFAICL